MNRSINRDYDIPIHLKGVRESIDEFEHHITMLECVGYKPILEIERMKELCLKLSI